MRTMRIFMPSAEEVGELCEVFYINVRDVQKEEIDYELLLVDLIELDRTTLVDIKTTILIDELLEANLTNPDLEVYQEKAKIEKGSFAIVKEKYVTYYGRLVVLERANLRTRIIYEIHSRRTTIHPGRNKTRILASSQYQWPGMSADVDRFVAHYIACRLAKAPRDKTLGLLQPLPALKLPQKDIVVDFKEIPKDKHGYNNMYMMVDRLSKSIWTVKCYKTAIAADAVMLYYKGPYRCYSLLRSVVSNRGPQFIADFTNKLAKILQISQKLSSLGHLQTAGQAEIINEYLNQRLRPFISYY